MASPTDVVAEVLLACPEDLLTETFEWFVATLGFRMEQPRIGLTLRNIAIRYTHNSLPDTDGALGSQRGV